MNNYECPFCSSPVKTREDESDDAYTVAYCTEHFCGAVGPSKYTAEEALEAFCNPPMMMKRIRDLEAKCRKMESDAEHQGDVLADLQDSIRESFADKEELNHE